MKSNQVNLTNASTHHRVSKNENIDYTIFRLRLFIVINDSFEFPMLIISFTAHLF